MTALSVDTILGFTDLFSNNVSENVLPFFAPFTNYDLHEISAQPEALDVVYDRIRDLLATSGNSGLITLSEKPSIASVITARLLQESKSDYITRQFQAFLNHFINQDFDLNYEWNITLHGGIFYWRDDAKMVKELVSQGSKGLIPRLLSYHDQTLEDYSGAELYVDALDIKVITEDTNDYEETNPVGRPSLSPEEVDNDNTASSKDAGTNVSEIKDFVLENGLAEDLMAELEEEM